MDFPAPSVEPSPRWVRVRAGDIWVADSRRALLLAWYGPGMLPTYCFPADDVRLDLLRPSSASGASPLEVDHDVLVGDQVLEGAAQLFLEFPPPRSDLPGHWSFTWDGRVWWFEEAQEIHVHPRVPTHRVDAVPSERHVRVEIAGELIAESRRPHALFETSLPTRWYLPVDDVQWDLLEPSETVTTCPYKGTARYWSVRAGGELHATWCGPIRSRWWSARASAGWSASSTRRST